MQMKNSVEKPKGDPRKPPERTKYLNIIYFIDSNRTRTLKFSIGTSYLTVGLLVTAVVWSLVSTGLLIRDHWILSDMQTHTRSLLDTVFNYQTRYDEVYEKAYPSSESNLTVTDTPKAETKETKPESKKESQRPDKAVENTSSSDRVLPQKVSEKISLLPKDESVPPLSIDNFSTQINDKNLLIRLSLKNLDSPNKTSGSVKARATFVAQDNKSYDLESHPTKTGDDTGNGEHFNIRFFKNKAFFFQPPKNIQGRFLSVVVTIKDESGRAKDFQYPLNKRIDAISKDIGTSPPTEHEEDSSDSDEPVMKASDSDSAEPTD